MLQEGRVQVWSAIRFERLGGEHSVDLHFLIIMTKIRLNEGG